MKKLLKATQALLGILFVALLMPLTSCSNYNGDRYLRAFAVSEIEEI